MSKKTLGKKEQPKQKDQLNSRRYSASSALPSESITTPKDARKELY